MKTNKLILAAFAAMIMLSCSKEMARETAVPDNHGTVLNEICFLAEGPEIDIQTKVNAVTASNLMSFNVMATTGAANAETKEWYCTASRSGMGSPFSTGRYWPEADPSYHFYASNAAMTGVSNGATVSVDGVTDVVTAHIATTSWNTSNVFNFRHVLARIGNVSVASNKGYTVSGVSIGLLNGKTTGTYNIKSASWSGTNQVDRITLVQGKNDHYVIPGTYTISVSYTLTKGDYTGSFTKTGDVVVTDGKTNNIEITLASDPAVPISFTISLSDWENLSVPLTVV